MPEHLSDKSLQPADQPIDPYSDVRDQEDEKKYLTINETDGGKAVELDRVALQEAIDGKGLYEVRE